MKRASALLLTLLLASTPSWAVQIGDLPGEDVTGTEDAVEQSQPKVKSSAAAQTRDPSVTWLAPPVEEQLSRDRTLIPLGKGALFVPAFAEGRREPEVSLYNDRNKLLRSGQTGERILLDSGSYTVRYGSGTVSQQLSVQVRIEEGHTTVIPPDWGAVLVETLTQEGEYIDGQYELIRMEKWVNYGRGRGLKEERLQDIKAWIVPPGLYRISKIGEGFNSLRNYITLQVNPGELSVVELIQDKESQDIEGGGIKALNTRVKVGSNWTYGLRAGGNLNLTREVPDDGVRKETMLVSSDMRLRLIFDNVKYIGTSELFFQDNFAKERGRRLSVTSDDAQFRTTWVRRLNDWLGPYVRGSIRSHVFAKKADKDTVTVIRLPADTLTITEGGFVVEPPFDPINFGQGIGVNIEMLSRYYLEASTQVGLAGRQTWADESFVTTPTNEYKQSESSYEIGAEAILNARARLAAQVTLDLRTELFFPEAVPSRIRLDDLTADFRFFISSNVEIGYVYQVQEKQGKVKNRFPRTHNLSLRLSLNY